MNGSVRTVTLGTWNGKCVAVKQLKNGSKADAGSEMMEREAALLFALRGSSHIMPLLGYCRGVQVFECMQPIALPALHPRRRLEIAADAAAAVAELHTASAGPFVHRDLHQGQLMMDANGKVYLQDLNEVQYVGRRRKRAGVCAPTGLGMAVNLTFSPEEMRRWLAKEGGHTRFGKWLAVSVDRVHDHDDDDDDDDELDVKFEVFHLGWLLWSILTLKPAHFRTKWTDAWRLVLSDPNWARHAPAVGKYLSWFPSEVGAAVLPCWEDDPASRPTSAEVAVRLQEIVLRLRREGAARGGVAGAG